MVDSPFDLLGHTVIRLRPKEEECFSIEENIPSLKQLKAFDNPPPIVITWGSIILIT